LKLEILTWSKEYQSSSED